MAAPAGSRLVSNMVPSIARHGDGHAFAFGSPGASRITTTILQGWISMGFEGMGFEDMVRAPRLHVEKIDGEFVRDILSDPVDKAMVDTIKRIGGVLGMTTIAEAIEDAETCKLLTAMGIEYGQGYHLARPGPVKFMPPKRRISLVKV